MSYANKDNYNFTPEEADELWVDTFGNVASAIDANGVTIHRDKHGKTVQHGWEIDHIWPKKNLETIGLRRITINSKENLRPLNWQNNRSKSDEYPMYICASEFISLARVLFPSMTAMKLLEILVDWVDWSYREHF